MAVPLTSGWVETGITLAHEGHLTIQVAALSAEFGGEPIRILGGGVFADSIYLGLEYDFPTTLCSASSWYTAAVVKLYTRKFLGVSPTTVGTVRRELESSGELSKLDSSIGADGKERPRERAPVTILAPTTRDTERVQSELRMLERTRPAIMAYDPRPPGAPIQTVEDLRRQAERIEWPATERPKALPVEGACTAYSVILCDPPWRWRNWNSEELAKRGEKWGRANGRSPYDTMDTPDLCALPVADIAARDCVLFLWATFPKLEEAFQLINAWGFEYKTVAFTWVKQNPLGEGWKFGLGYWTRGNAEICLLATRGEPKRVSESVSQLVIAPVGEHSAKPVQVRERIVELMGDLPRVELFAREKVPGWDAMGDGVDGCDITDTLHVRVSQSEDGES